MRLRQITLQHFRNIGFARVELAGRQVAFVGANGQGKTNLLEAVAYLTALRSFRTTDSRALIAHGQAEAGLVVDLEHEVHGPTQVTIRLRAGGKEAWIDQTRVTRLADFLGQFPTVVFSSQDQQLIRGSPGLRRRWLDLTLAAMDGRYFAALQGYHRALADRNLLLKRQATDAEIAAFERPLAEQGEVLMQARALGLEELGQALAAAYSQISHNAEPVAFVYAPDQAGADAAALLARFESGRGRDRQVRTTSSGPHRDDFAFLLRDRPAREFASEGQQRTLVLALRLAQATYFRARGRAQPVLLADDVLGELDPARRRRFWDAIPADAQVLATGTTPPDAALGDWQIHQVAAGTFTAGTAG